MEKMVLNIEKPKVRVTTKELGFVGNTGTKIFKPKKGKGSYSRKKKHKKSYDEE